MPRPNSRIAVPAPALDDRPAYRWWRSSSGVRGPGCKSAWPLRLHGAATFSRDDVRCLLAEQAPRHAMLLREVGILRLVEGDLARRSRRDRDPQIRVAAGAASASAIQRDQ